MVKKAIDRKQLLKDFNKKLSKKNDILNQSPNTSYKTIHTLIVKTLIDFAWEPCYNEKAIMIDLLGKEAWHLWYVGEVFDSYYRFREVPNDFPIVFNYYRQPITPPPSKKIYTLVLPLAIFKEIKKIIKFKVIPDKHKALKDSPLINHTYKTF